MSKIGIRKFEVNGIEEKIERGRKEEKRCWKCSEEKVERRRREEREGKEKKAYWRGTVLIIVSRGENLCLERGIKMWNWG